VAAHTSHESSERQAESRHDVGLQLDAPSDPPRPQVSLALRSPGRPGIRYFGNPRSIPARPEWGPIAAPQSSNSRAQRNSAGLELPIPRVVGTRRGTKSLERSCARLPIRANCEERCKKGTEASLRQSPVSCETIHVIEIMCMGHGCPKVPAFEDRSFWSAGWD
jgi:hypothetical protein